MAVQITVPKLGLSMSDVKIVEWKVKEGDSVEKGTVVLVIETEKTELRPGQLRSLTPVD